MPHPGTSTSGSHSFVGHRCVARSLVATILDIRMKTAVPIILAGVIVAGNITMLVTSRVRSLFSM